MSEPGAAGGPPPADEAVLTALRAVIDPELGVNIVDLGLVYGIDRGPSALTIRMTLTSPGCPLGPMLVDDVRAALAPLLPDGAALGVELVWQPEWGPARMSERARRVLGWDDGDTTLAGPE